jgi:hypothetical protein
MASLFRFVGILLFLFGFWWMLSSGAPIALCFTLPFAAAFFSVAGRMKKSEEEKLRHQETLELQRENLELQRQATAAQMAQAQLQFESSRRAQVQPSTSTQSALPANTEATRAQLQAAKALIDAKNFTAARALLHTIDHEKAREWLSKLDSLNA